MTAVVPWRDHLELAPDFWKAIHAADELEALIVDDGSEPALPNAHRIERAGFSRACNVGLELAQTEAVLFLNNDIEATVPAWDCPIREALEPGVLVGACLRYDPHGMVEGMPMPYLDGWCLAGMRDDLLDIGGFDEDYEEPAYYSDNDLCLRARVAGMSLREVRVGLRHKGGCTTGGPQTAQVQEVTRRNQERFRSRVLELVGESVDDGRAPQLTAA